MRRHPGSGVDASCCGARERRMEPIFVRMRQTEPLAWSRVWKGRCVATRSCWRPMLAVSLHFWHTFSSKNLLQGILETGDEMLCLVCSTAGAQIVALPVASENSHASTALTLECEQNESKCCLSRKCIPMMAPEHTELHPRHESTKEELPCKRDTNGRSAITW